ncbi:thioredoxin family protein [Aneurinibacillus sp. BA2021]|nr:thioredoxin family protein [Aneurinibacillus sp. BA2021]
MNEWSSAQIEARYAGADDAPFAVYFYTPLCGTCAVAEKMLSVIEAASPGLPLYKCNINFAPELARAWQIASVPCLALITEGTHVRKLYAMRSVPDLYNELKPLMNKET